MPSPDLFLTQGERIAYPIPVETLRSELLEVSIVERAGFHVSVLGEDEHWHDVVKFDGTTIYCADGYTERVL